VEVGADATGAESMLKKLSTASSPDINLSVTIEEFSSAPDLSAEFPQRTETFQGIPVLCDSLESKSSETFSPGFVALCGPKPDSQRKTMLEGEINRIDELLEFEPECKWALLARGFLSTACAGPEDLEKVVKAVSDGYEKMIAIDPLRTGFYKEALAGCQLRLQTMRWLADGASFGSALNAARLNLRHLAPATMLAAIGVRTLVIEDNELEELSTILLLPSLEVLRAARNRLRGEATAAFALPQLREADLKGNLLTLTAGATAQPIPRNLKVVDVSENPSIVAKAKDATEAAMVKHMFGESSSWTCDLDTGASRCLFQRSS